MIHDVAVLRASCRELAARLEGKPDWDTVRAVYLELAPLVGELQGAVGEYTHAHGEAEEARRAEAAFAQARASFRRVGLDIRLASPGALAMGLETALQSALETLDWLQRIDASEG